MPPVTYSCPKCRKEWKENSEFPRDGTVKKFCVDCKRIQNKYNLHNIIPSPNTKNTKENL